MSGFALYIVDDDGYVSVWHAFTVDDHFSDIVPSNARIISEVNN